MSAGINLAAPARRIVERTRREQGLPPAIEDPVVLGRIAQLITDTERNTR